MTHINVEGLMTIAPYGEDTKKIRKCFYILRRLAEDIEQDMLNNINMKYLSMGMSNDFEIAIEEGANILRIGTAIFVETIVVAGFSNKGQSQALAPKKSHLQVFDRKQAKAYDYHYKKYSPTKNMKPKGILEVNIGIIGSGNMGSALIKGMLKAKLINKNIFATDLDILKLKK